VTILDIGPAGPEIDERRQAPNAEPRPLPVQQARFGDPGLVPLT